MSTRERMLKKLHAELFKDYRKPPYLSSWRGYLNACYEVASKKKQYERASLINDLIRFDIIEPGPHTDNELKQLISEY